MNNAKIMGSVYKLIGKKKKKKKEENNVSRVLNNETIFCVARYGFCGKGMVLP